MGHWLVGWWEGWFGNHRLVVVKRNSSQHIRGKILMLIGWLVVFFGSEVEWLGGRVV